MSSAGDPRLAERDRPWVMRTYAGHSSAAASNALFRRNLAKGQTGLSVAFDLPTQTGYDPDHELARGEVGRVGVPVSHLGDARALFDGLDLRAANTSMTINATAMWLLALYVTVAEEQGAPLEALAGTTQNDIVKEYLSRGTYIFPPGPSLRLTTDTIAWAVANCPKWNPVNICSYHLQEAGATPVQEVGFALATAVAVLDAVRDSGQVAPDRMGDVVARISFFVNAGVRFVEEMCKMRAFAALWDELTAQRYGVTDADGPPVPLRRAGQLARPHRGAAGEQRPAHRAGDARRDALPRRARPGGAAAGLERGARPAPAVGPAVVAADPAGARVRVGSAGVPGPVRGLAASSSALTESIVDGARAELDRVLELGGVVAAVESGYLKSALVASLAERRAPGRVGRGRRRRRQPVHRDRAVAADRRRRRRRSSRSTPRSRRPPSTPYGPGGRGGTPADGRRPPSTGCAPPPVPART